MALKLPPLQKAVGMGFPLSGAGKGGVGGGIHRVSDPVRISDTNSGLVV